MDSTKLSIDEVIKLKNYQRFQFLIDLFLDKAKRAGRKMSERELAHNAGVHYASYRNIRFYDTPFKLTKINEALCSFCGINPLLMTDDSRWEQEVYKIFGVRRAEELRYDSKEDMGKLLELKELEIEQLAASVLFWRTQSSKLLQIL